MPGAPIQSLPAVQRCRIEADLLRRQRTCLRLPADVLLAYSELCSKRDKQKLRLQGAGRLLASVGCTGTTSICETMLATAWDSVNYVTWAAGSNPVRKRALGASRRDTCFLSFRQLGQILGGGRSGRADNRIENAAAHCAAHSEVTTQHAIRVM